MPPYSFIVVLLLLSWGHGMEMEHRVNLLTELIFENGYYPLSVLERIDTNSDLGRALDDSFMRSFITVSKWNNDSSQKQISYLLYIFKSIQDLNVTEVDAFLKDFTNKRVLLFPMEPTQKASLDTLKDTFEDLTTVSSFLWIEGPYEVFEVLKLGRLLNPIVKQHDVRKNQLKLRQEIMDLQGIHLRMVAIAWFPYVIIECSEDLSLPCHCSGLSMDLVDILSDVMNFTMDCYLEVSGDWGTNRIDYDEDGSVGGVANWTGMLGAIYEESFDMAIPLFSSTTYKEPYFSFVECMNTETAGFYFEYSDNYFLLFQPFNEASWITILVFICLVTALILILKSLTRDYLRTQSYRILITSLAFLFVILNAYYGGALTMFFSTYPKHLFKSLVDVINNPFWELVYLNGTERIELERLSRENERARIFQEKIMAEPKKYLVNSVVQALERAKRKRVVFYEDLILIVSNIGYSKYLLERYKDYIIFDRRKIFRNFVFKKHSPWPKILESTLLALSAVGISDKEIKEELGKVEVQSMHSSQFAALKLPQMSLAFFFLSFGMVVSILVLMGERIWRLRKKEKMIFSRKQESHELMDNKASMKRKTTILNYEN